ncbi:MAG TPA: UDP-N-acetylmuramoyl-L-alanyl-D-glutamate--2,6-diaminopimelate ligase [Thiotrichaceae bacterium]|jgi:UDP-N-acetylmuramoyl-L-alanyl-D-glutamate--2,6-diaminopimelate ligase|nr:UDP-N-acetylmuramoyl-L-alanyl-D-glutamate--2,6-diaminopimelate ligase [Thiotrichaceae bacterium]HIM07166.1 UDP-N-acetylmuramoyl-L-alanyl-D-glutamate--2,6-diaminopimelate ligase [Gammaproteobacteria bacterium]
MMTAEKLNYSKSLDELLSGLANVKSSMVVTGVAIDSRQVRSGDLFMAYRGTEVNGVDYIDHAIQAGAVAIVIDEDEKIDLQLISVDVFKIDNLRKQAGIIISRFYDEPSKQMEVIGVTGTNGKTTVSYMVAQVLFMLGKKSAVVGTIGNGPFGKVESANTTTPDPVKLHSLFSSWAGDIDSVVMEVSSHALDQGRVAGVEFNSAVFTNLSRDHLDYHKTFEDYADAKSQLFRLSCLKHAIVNIDDYYGLKLIDLLPIGINIYAYSTKAKQEDINRKNVSFVFCEKIEVDHLKTKLTIQSPWGQVTITTGLLGQFNIENILAAYTSLCISDLSAEQVAEALSKFNGVPGRMEYFSSQNDSNSKPLLIVDYAHTPDALEKVLTALRPYCKGKLFCIFGCGGDRDTGKRSQMGAIAEALSDQVVITNDNPRTETEEKIVEDILVGIKDKSKATIKYDRSDAIINTFLNADKNDVILIAGKGHETTQQVGTMLLPFSDRELARRLTEGDS